MFEYFSDADEIIQWLEKWSFTVFFFFIYFFIQSTNTHYIYCVELVFLIREKKTKMQRTFVVEKNQSSRRMNSGQCWKV